VQPVPSPTSPALVADPESLARLVETLRAEPVVALDTESNSFHVYRERVCLLQVSTPAGDHVVDPLAVDVRPLGEVLCDGREVVLHGADYDVRCLKREYGWRFPRLFDTMAATRRLGHAGLGLSAVVEAHFGVKLSKGSQRSDWGQRPLTRDQLAYAALDTHYLLGVHARLVAELEARGLMAAAREEFARIAAVEPRERVFDPEGWRRIKGARELDAAGERILRALYLAREDRSRAADRPPFKVLGDHTMLALARARPRTAAELRAVHGVTPSVLRRMGEAILQAVEAGDRAPAPER
jgi:ribonuclease D